MTAIPLYGITELAEATGCKPGTISQWYRRGKLPEPTARLAMGPVWAGDDVAFAAQRRRRSPTAEPPNQAVRQAVRQLLADALVQRGYAEEVMDQVVEELASGLDAAGAGRSPTLADWCLARAEQLTGDAGGGRHAGPAGRGRRPVPPRRGLAGLRGVRPRRRGAPAPRAGGAVGGARPGPGRALTTAFCPR